VIDLQIKYSPEKDAETYINYIYKFNSYKHGRVNPQKELLSKLEPALQEILTNAKNESSAYKEVLDYLTKNNESDPQTLSRSIDTFEKRWEVVGENIIYSLEFLFKKPFPFNEVTVYLTTNNICPYSYEDKYFFANYKYASEQLETVKHELNHFMFYFYYKDLKNKLNEEKYELLKESLTFFSNPIQSGKPNENPIRTLFRSKIWENIDDAINAAVNLLLKTS